YGAGATRRRRVFAQSGGSVEGPSRRLGAGGRSSRLPKSPIGWWETAAPTEATPKPDLSPFQARTWKWALGPTGELPSGKQIAVYFGRKERWRSEEHTSELQSR